MPVWSVVVDSPDPVADRVSLTIGEKLLKDASPHIAEYLNNENGQGYGEDTRATQEVNEMTPPISPVAPVEGHMTMETALEEIREMELQMLQTSRGCASYSVSCSHSHASPKRHTPYSLYTASHGYTSAKPLLATPLLATPLLATPLLNMPLLALPPGLDSPIITPICCNLLTTL